MRTVSLSSRLQWAFRGTVLPGALATGDVDSDGCKEFVVGSVQGELAVFRGRGGCGSWQHSEDQIEPEYDCWDAVARGEIPQEAVCPAGSNASGIKRQSTYNSIASNRESLSVDEIMHMLDGHDKPLASAPTGSCDSSSDELDGERGAAEQAWDPDINGHMKWEDALDIERDGRKPWILAQKLGTISSVAVADISNSGHNSIVVVNGEGKCHIFDYPFKRRLHPDIDKRRRQRNHYRRFSQARFFRDKSEVGHSLFAGNSEMPPGEFSGAGVVPPAPPPPPLAHRSKSAFAEGMGTAIAGQNPAQQHTRSTSISSPAMRNFAVLGAQPEIAYSQSADALGLQQRIMPAGDTTHGASTVTITEDSRAGSIGVGSNHTPPPKASWRPNSGIESQIDDSHASSYLISGYDMGASSNMSSHVDPPLTMLTGRVGKDPASFADSNPVEMNQMPSSPYANRTAAATTSKQGGYSAETGSSNGRRRPGTSYDALSAVFGDADIDTDQDSDDALSDHEDGLLLTAEEVADIEKIWGADVGKRSGDWFPFVLDRPDATFDIPTNVEHALVADIDNNGLNELVLTSTDGFVYIFRVEARMKHTLNPTITSLGVFSNIPTTIPSVDATGNGSPYLHMSAPRSPDASDLDLDGANHAKPRSGLNRQLSHKDLPEQQSHNSEAQSDMNLVNNLLRSIKDVSATESLHDEESRLKPSFHNGNVSAPSEEQAVSVRNTTRAAARRQSAGCRSTLTSRMRENFSTIVSGSETPRRPSSTFNRTAPASLNHSRVTTANNSGSSTNAHSRRPSLGTDTADILHNGAGTSIVDSDVHLFQLKAPSIVQATNVMVTSDVRRSPHRQRGRNNTICIGGLDTSTSLAAEAAGNIPEAACSELPSIMEISPSAPISRQLTTAKQADLNSLPKHDNKNTVAIRDFESLNTAENGEAVVANRLARTSGSRMHSRRNSIARSVAAGSRAHSRRSSISSVIGKPRIPGMPQDPNSNSFHGYKEDSRRESIGSNISNCESSTNNNSTASHTTVPPAAGAATAAATAVNARASFSTHSQKPAKGEASEDSSSLISQVTERLESLSFKAKGKLSESNRNTDTHVAAPMANRRSTNTFIESLEHEMAAQLPPPRSIVDWRTINADKVATWFLDNIPGGISIINVPADAFGEPVSSRRRIVYTDDSTDLSCSSCSCSLCGNSSDSSDSESLNENRMGRVVGVQPPPTVPKNKRPKTLAASATLDTAVSPPAVDKNALKYGTMASSLGVLSNSAAACSGLNLPQPLGLESVNSERIDSVPAKPAPNTPSTASNSSKAEHGKQQTSVAPLQGKPQQFLLLSKPGGRFVPIDMKQGVILPTVDPPKVVQSVLTGGNTAHMMNVDASGSMLNFPLSMDPLLLHNSNVDMTATTGSYLCRSPSWQSESIPWTSHAQPMSFQGTVIRSPVNVTEAEAFRPSTGQKSAFQTVEQSAQNRGNDIYAQRPYDESHPNDSSVPLSAAEPGATQQIGTELPKQPTSGTSYTSVFKPSPASGAISLTGNMRPRHSLHRPSYEFLRNQQLARPAQSPGYRGSSRSGTMTPVGGQFERRQLGYAGLRGYIGGNGNRGFSGISQGLTTGTMPREPAPGYFSSLSTNASVLNVSRIGTDVSRANLRMPYGQPMTPGLTSASPQRGMYQSRYSPSMIGWSSYRDGNMLTTIHDHPEGDVHGEHRHSAEAVTSSPVADVPTTVDRAFWLNNEMVSARSHSSLGTGASVQQTNATNEKEEEIEQAPAPMEFDVATYVVGGVTPGKRYRRVVSEKEEEDPAADDSTDGIGELVSMVTMDGVISCYDPTRKVTHYVSLSSRDPVLGIWKAKMHDEVCYPSPLESMVRDGQVSLDDNTGERLLNSTPAKRIYRRVGLSHRDLLDAVHFATSVEDSVFTVGLLESHRRFRRRLRQQRGCRKRNAHPRVASYGTSGDKQSHGKLESHQSPLRMQRGTPQIRPMQSGRNGRLRETLGYTRMGRAVRSIGSHIRDFAGSAYPSDSTAPPFASSQAIAKDESSQAPPSEAATPNASFSPANRKFALGSGNQTQPSASWTDPASMQRSLEADVATALSGWYGRNRHDFRNKLHNVSDHLIVSTWRGTTFFVDVSTLMDIAHYSELFMHRWNTNMAAAAAEAALVSDKDGGDTHSTSLSAICGQLCNFSDISGLISRLRPNASVVQFKFQDTVSAFLADLYAPATGGPNVPCLFYVDYKDRIWTYYHLDEIAEMDDVYGATWMSGEPDQLHTPESRARAAKNGVDFINYDKPFSVVDLAYRRINLDPWTPEKDSTLFQVLVAHAQTSYPYSAKSWSKPARVSKPASEGHEATDDLLNRSSRGELSCTPSENSTQAHSWQPTANVTGRYHPSFLPGPYLCPIWADINSVDLYDVGVCNLLELAMPELLAMKHVFCQALDISTSSVDERTNLATIPGMADWVRSCLYFS
ncbi:hypothetical protein IWW36_000141 [Coemansia brasiliensis]|uniref:Uncharacterized protein n=1 Tax=Coemansia brasiliensis TaxID=2650707 RepID=A0A9W8M062_9FUNG|nr:hypothetical protein IWW36_000141 [Coemansia brasiliensis]